MQIKAYFDNHYQWLNDLGDDWKNRSIDASGELTMLQDMNNDGLPDRVFDRNLYNNAQGLYVMLNTGTGFTAGSQWSQDLGDRPGNGRFSFQKLVYKQGLWSTQLSNHSGWVCSLLLCDWSC